MKKSAEMMIRANVIECLESYLEDIERNISYYEEVIENNEGDDDSHYIKSVKETIETECAKKKFVLKLIDSI